MDAGAPSLGRAAVVVTAIVVVLFSLDVFRAFNKAPPRAQGPEGGGRHPQGSGGGGGGRYPLPVAEGAQGLGAAVKEALDEVQKQQREEMREGQYWNQGHQQHQHQHQHQHEHKDSDLLEGFEDMGNEEKSEGERGEVKQLLQAQFPGLEVTLGNYPVPAVRAALSKALSAAQMALIAVAVAGDSILPLVGVHPPFPQWYVSVQQNKVGAALGAWIVGNSVNNMIVSTGAFEVYVDGALAFSKLQQNRMPSLEEVKAAVARGAG